ncbi:AAA domain-containing protein [Ferruginibacter paludis]|uniref:AAA domain-containing protein n=1 Tax=Ferruginibacter paludis TaxID=1310417 RepID=UPI0025B3FD19|nr:AAA domain-containing protein [Ferruginibacter paludis]MDN3655824.1 AAA domain-containing protein [Ferruginibacter paludis]
MPVTDPHINLLLQCISLEEKEQVKRFSLDQQHTLKSLKAEGLALHPITVTRKNFGYADYPEISFRINFPAETNQFKDGAAIECFYTGEEPVKGVLMSLDGKAGEFRLFAPDFPDWIEDNGVGIKLAPDQRTTTIMKTVLNNLEGNKELYQLFRQIHNETASPITLTALKNTVFHFNNKRLNESQQNAVKAIVQNELITIVHGPPGTGKTTTLTEAITQLIKAGEKVLVSAPSNTAVDNIARGLIAQGVQVLRVGNTSKVDETIFLHTPEGRLANSKQQKEIKELKIRAEQFRKMALKYKRSFGKAEREQRNLLFKEVKNIRAEIKKIQAYNEEKLYTEAEVVAGTPIGLHDAKINHITFNTLVMDEAGQCIEPLAWCIFPLAEKYVLTGDHLQLPPTILSNEAARLGLNQSILEKCIATVGNIYLLNIQYRMKESIAGFSSSYFYNGLLNTAAHLINTGTHISFIDTAGSGFNEVQGSNGMSLQNEGELQVAQKLMQTDALPPEQTAFISPYNGQVAAAKELLPAAMRISTIDSFQGQEKEIIILSLVRSNDDGDIGFLKDYRRMNVAITRAKEQLFIIGDSATIGGDAFYNSFLTYIEKYGSYRTVWEFEL